LRVPTELDMVIYEYYQRQQTLERAFESLDGALDAACDDLEGMKACPHAIWQDGQVVLNLNRIGREWEKRHWSKVSPLLAAEYAKK
jgi:hypothetical protein